MDYSTLKVGDRVYIKHEADIKDVNKESTVTDIQTEYDIRTGEPYKVLLFDKVRYSMETGRSLFPYGGYKIQGLVEKFSKEDVIKAIEGFLELRGRGWQSRCLRDHLKELQKEG